jgi:hypothetical protein
MSVSGGLLSRLRQSEYTGENRCLPCTVVNTAIAVVLSAAVGTAAVVGSATVPLGVALGLGTFALCAAAIYLRGYLVPGTPQLTKQYFPPWLLELFGKEQPEGLADRDARLDEEFDPERELTAVGALEECVDGEDLCLTDEFRADWMAAIDRVKEADADRTELLSVLNVEEGEVEYEEYGNAFRARVNEKRAGKWESRAAFLADLGAARVLERRHPHWDRFGLRERSQLLNGLRLFIDACPSCGATPEFGTDTVESCCSTHQVAAVSCTGCGARLFESDPIR